MNAPVLPPISINTPEAWLVAVESLLDRIEWLMPQHVSALRGLLFTHPMRGLL